MKSTTMLFSLCAFLMLSCHTSQKAQTAANQAAEPAKPAPFVTWDKKLIDLGSIKKGETRDMVFEFTNTSGEPIQIEIVDACECTTVDFPRGIIEPGGKGKIPATFDSAKKDASETIAIHLYFKQLDPQGNPRIERIEYKFELLL